MAFEVSAVRSRYFPPSFKRVFALCGNRNNIYAETELLKVDVEADMKLVVSIYVYPLESTLGDA